MRSKRLNRCGTCGLSENLCLCSELPLVTPKARVVILAHKAELVKPTNTGKICAQMLGAQAYVLRSDAPPPYRWSNDCADSTWVLFPSDDAVPLDAVRDQVGTLIVPDGTWAQARRIARRHLGCRAVAKVQLVAPPSSSYRLRRNRGLAGLCTLEAVAYALAVLENPSCAHTLLATFETWVERALLVRAGAHEMRSAQPPAADRTGERTSFATAR